MRKRAFRFLLVLMLAAVCILPAAADDGQEQVLDLVQGSVTLTEPGTYRIVGYGVQTANAVTVSAGSGGGRYNVTLDNVNISAGTALSISGNPSVFLTLAGENTLTSSKGPGLEVGGSGNISIDGTGSLTAQGGRGESGIGGSDCGAIAIRGGTIRATSGYGSAVAIGGNRCSGIHIYGGNVTAVSNRSSDKKTQVPAIGSYASGSTMRLTISGGTVNATGSLAFNARTVSISGGSVTANGGILATCTAAEENAVAISGGTVAVPDGGILGRQIVISGGQVEAVGEPAIGYNCTSSASSASVTISGGTVTASGTGFVIGAVPGGTPISSTVNISGATVNVFSECADGVVGAKYRLRQVASSIVKVKNASVFMGNAGSDFYTVGNASGNIGTPRRYCVRGLTAPFTVTAGSETFIIPASHDADSDYLHLYLDETVTDITVNGQPCSPEDDAVLPAGGDLILYAPGTYTVQGDGQTVTGRILCKGTGALNVTFENVKLTNTRIPLVLCAQELALRLEGENSAACTAAQSPTLHMGSGCAMTVSGSGALKLENVFGSVVSGGGSLTVEGGDLAVINPSESLRFYGIALKSVNVNGGTLQTNCGIGGVNGCAVTVSGGALNAEYGGQSVSADITVTGGALIVDIHYNIGGASCNITVSGGRVKAGSMTCAALNVSGGEVELSGSSHSAIKAGQVTLTGGTVTASASSNGYGYGIEADTILVGACSVKAVGAETRGAMSSEPRAAAAPYGAVSLHTYSVAGLDAPYEVRVGEESFTVPAAHPGDEQLYLYLDGTQAVTINGRSYELFLTDSQGRWVCDLAGQSTCTVHMQRREALEEECRLAVASYDAQGRFLSVAIYSVEAGSGTFSAQLTLPAGAGMVKIFLMSDQYAPLSSFASI